MCKVLGTIEPTVQCSCVVGYGDSAADARCVARAPAAPVSMNPPAINQMICFKPHYIAEIASGPSGEAMAVYPRS